MGGLSVKPTKESACVRVSERERETAVVAVVAATNTAAAAAETPHWPAKVTHIFATTAVASLGLAVP